MFVSCDSFGCILHFSVSFADTSLVVINHRKVLSEILLIGMKRINHVRNGAMVGIVSDQESDHFGFVLPTEFLL